MPGGRITDEDIQKVRDASDIVAVFSERVPVKQRGRDFWCCCPFHNEKSPSCKIDPALQLWHCFGCGEGGDVFAFIMKAEDLSFPEAVHRLAERAHIDIVEVGGKPAAPASKKARLKDICKATAEFYHLQLMRSTAPDAAAAREYLSGRGLGGKVPNDWNLGFAPGRGALTRHLSSKGFKADEMVEANVCSRDSQGKLRDRFYNRVMFPINDVSGDCIAFGGRVIGTGEPKYLNSQETPLFHKSQVLYGLDKAKVSMASSGVAIVCEGYTDVIALYEGGVRNAVATLGTALTMRHIRILARHAQKKIVYLFDGDAAGQKAADRALEFIDSSMTPEAGKTRIELCAVTLPDNLDPAEFMGSHGGAELEELIEHAQPLLKYGIDRRLAAHDLSSAEGRSAALASALSVLAPIKDSLLAKDYAIQIAGRTRAREEDVLEALAKLEPPARFGDAGETSEARGPVPVGAPPRRAISKTELNRLRLERELLSVLSQHPLIALTHADALAQTQWHDPLHATLATSILDTLASDPAASAAAIVSNASAADARAGRVLTAGGSSTETASPEDVARFLIEELAIGDAEDAIEELRAQLANESLAGTEEYDFLFQATTALQKELLEKRRAHKPVAHEGRL